MSDVKKIIAFFLDLYRLQCGDAITDDQPPEYRRIPSGKGSDPIYELRVKCKDGLKTRRMSVRQIGERVESKSTCYKVIYDDQLVVKIPPSRITSFKTYLKYINNQRQISHRLAHSIRCLSPSLTAILKKIPSITPKGTKTEKGLEEEYIRLLIRRPRLQNYLKIGGGVVFFMHLARDSFLNQVIAKIHETKSRIQSEITSNSRWLESLHTFEDIYGDDNDTLFFEINRLYNGFEKELNALASGFNPPPAIPDYTKKEWFLSVLAKETPAIDPDEFSDRFREAAYGISHNLELEAEETIHQFRKAILKKVRKKIFDNNRAKFEGLIINILKLLYYLKKRSVSVRDLKPDNIFISGNLEGAYQLLAAPHAYSLGLIDLETAVVFHEHGKKRLRQPLLAGTPSYMTPSHIFRNNTLHDVFDAEILRVLYLQDWFAAVGMIYNVTTGKTLFKKTARLIPRIIERLKSAVKADASPADVLKGTSWGFWTAAENDFYKRTDRYKEQFSAMIISLPESVTRMLKNELKREASVLEAAITEDRRLRVLPPASREKIIRMPYDEMVQYRLNWEKGKHGSDLPTKTRERVVRLLLRMERQKRQLGLHDRLTRLLDQPICCYDLMVFLFNRVLYGMYRQAWSRKEAPGREHLIFKGLRDEKP